MVIKINQRKITFGTKYDIDIDGERKYFAESELFRIFSVIHLQKNSNDIPSPILTIYKRFYFFKRKYDIELTNGEIIPFRTVSFWTSEYQSIYKNDVYDLYTHRGTLYSIFKNNVQIAWWRKDFITWFAGDIYTIIADNDCDAELLISFCLIIDNALKRNKGGLFRMNFGNNNIFLKEFNPYWRPNA